MKKDAVVVENLSMFRIKENQEHTLSAFDILQLPISIEINQADLEAKYLRFQQELHPDNFIDDPLMQQSASKLSEQVNHAYQQLKSLKGILNACMIACGVTIESLDTTLNDPTLMVEMMELKSLKEQGDSIMPYIHDAKRQFQQALENYQNKENHGAHQQNLISIYQRLMFLIRIENLC